MPLVLKQRHRDILKALYELGDGASTIQIAERTGLNANGVSQSLTALHEYVLLAGVSGRNLKWQLTKYGCRATKQ